MKTKQEKQVFVKNERVKKKKEKKSFTLRWLC